MKMYVACDICHTEKVTELTGGGYPLDHGSLFSVRSNFGSREKGEEGAFISPKPGFPVICKRCLVGIAEEVNQLSSRNYNFEKCLEIDGKKTW
jgi:hypothetical protein